MTLAFTKDELEWVASCAQRYHSRRRAFFEFLSRIDSIISMICGGSAFISITQGYPRIGAAAALAVALVNAVNLSVGSTEKAHKHEDLYRRWTRLVGRLREVDEGDTKALIALSRERTEISMDSPSQKEVLCVVCENEVREYMRSDEWHYVRWYQRVFAQVISLPPYDFPLKRKGQPG